MTNQNQETIADIVAQMRGLVKPGETLNNTYELLNGLADRIEVAHKREVGNTAKMREALVNISKYADCAAMRQHDATTQHYIEQIREWAEAALAELATPAVPSSAPHAAPRATPTQGSNT